jgi:hypothetical protein
MHHALRDESSVKRVWKKCTVLVLCFYKSPHSNRKIHTIPLSLLSHFHTFAVCSEHGLNLYNFKWVWEEWRWLLCTLIIVVYVATLSIIFIYTFCGTCVNLWRFDLCGITAETMQSTVSLTINTSSNSRRCGSKICYDTKTSPCLLSNHRHPQTIMPADSSHNVSPCLGNKS